ncbi:MAG: type I glyceraldehyde-3-phosphate dehydrogenase, partial [Synechococcaceae bacterium WB9_4xC_028]|nr:type I glyceraldehyde-3-phosphate dehydrogenase [Synechococcaceae bacterium WB9_4xC_028]
MRIGINGFGRIGRLVCRALWGRPGIEIVQINDNQATAESAAHLLCFDSVHGRWDRQAEALSETELLIDGRRLNFSRNGTPAEVSWSAAGVEMVLECSGRFKTTEALEPYFSQGGIQRVVVGCPVKGALNIVYGINHDLYDPNQHRLVTAASCTTNCLAPIVKVVHEQFGIRHGSITTLHDVTNTQVVVDAFKSDLRRSRSCLQSLIPTTTGSAKAIAMIFPELEGKLNGHAVRIPLLNACLLYTS